MQQPIIECRNLHKWYSGVQALRGVSLSIQQNETLGLVGDNGAGKSTLIKILSGAHTQDLGEILIHGKEVRFKSTKQAMDLGIEAIYQNDSLVPTLSVARNFFAGREPLVWSVCGIGMIRQDAMLHESMKAISKLGLKLSSAETLVGDLSGGQRQGVAIARAMHFKSKVLILDEPTNHMGVRETERVLEFIRGLRTSDVTSIFISHNIQHIFRACDRIVVMKHGAIALDCPVSATCVQEVHDLLLS